jgi:hypothetical protein
MAPVGIFTKRNRMQIKTILSKAIDEVRAQEARELKEKGYESILTKTRWLLLKRLENLTDKQDTKLAELLQYNLRSIRSYLLKEEQSRFQPVYRRSKVRGTPMHSRTTRNWVTIGSRSFNLLREVEGRNALVYNCYQ